jgi:hypothetical protein
MAILSRVAPSKVSPRIIYRQAQMVPFMKYFGGNIDYSLEEGQAAHYWNVVNGGGFAKASQTSMSQSMQEIFVQHDQIQANVYYIQARATLRDDAAAQYGQLGMPLAALQRATATTVMAQALHRGSLFGFNGTSGEGLINATGVGADMPGADSGGATTVAAYKTDELFAYLLGRIQFAESATRNRARVTYVASSVSIINSICNTKIVPLSGFQSAGAGSKTIAQAINETRKANSLPEIDFIADDSLKGKGASSKDLIILGLPNIINEAPIGGWNTNEFGQGPNSLDAQMLMAFATPDLVEKTYPIGADALESSYKQVVTPAVVVRPEGLYLISISA